MEKTCGVEQRSSSSLCGGVLRIVSSLSVTEFCCVVGAEESAGADLGADVSPTGSAACSLLFSGALMVLDWI